MHISQFLIDLPLTRALILQLHCEECDLSSGGSATRWRGKAPRAKVLARLRGNDAHLDLIRPPHLITLRVILLMVLLAFTEARGQVLVRVGSSHVEWHAGKVRVTV
jgi:hypothetical protein